MFTDIIANIPVSGFVLEIAVLKYEAWDQLDIFT